MAGLNRRFDLLGEDGTLAPALARAKTEMTRERVKQAAILLSFLLLCIVFTVLSPNFLTAQNIENIGRQSAVLIIIAVGITFVMIARELDLSVGAILVMTSMSVALLLQEGIPVGAAIPIAMLVGIVIGSINGFLTIGGLPSFLVTLAMLSLGRGAALTITGGSPVSITDTTFRDYVGELEIGPLPILIVVSIVTLVAAHVLLSRTRFGRHVYAVGGNELAARIAGVRTRRVILATFLISGLLAALAGILTTGRVLSATPLLATNIELDAIAAVVLGGTKLTGGRGSIPGTLVGALMIAVITNGLTLLGFLQGPQMMLKGAIILAVIALDRWAGR